jgi:hypothetical protein
MLTAEDARDEEASGLSLGVLCFLCGDYIDSIRI